ncbi:hypothetical protein PAEPH01_0203 [Pancytospora epiphaga]|nr:hypothetical protein PAEPH01_0203 [Pancytospora epiphaga]
MLLYDTLRVSALVLSRRATILKQKRTYSTHLATIVAYLTAKYGLLQLNADLIANGIKNVKETQRKLLYSEIKKKSCHESCIESGVMSLCTKYRIKAHSGMRSHSVQVIIANKNGRDLGRHSALNSNKG